jgi:hypothetical protein
MCFFILTNIRQVAKFVPMVYAKLEGEYVEVQQEADLEERTKDITNEGIAETGDSTSSETLECLDIIHVVGDIIQVRRHFLTSQIGA